jgi:hypothetical protein
MSVLEYVFQEENNNDNNNDNTNTNNFEFPGHPTLGHDERKNKKKNNANASPYGDYPRTSPEECPHAEEIRCV